MCKVPAALQSLGVATYALAHSCKMGAAGHSEWVQQALCFGTGMGLGYCEYFMKEGALEAAAWEPYLQDGGVLRAYAEMVFE